MESENLAILRQYSRKMVRELGILDLDHDDKKATAQNWHALIEISQNEKITISQLAKNLVFHLSTVSRIVNLLAEQGFVKENFGQDKREKTLQITKKGQQEIEKIDEFSNQKILNAFRFLGQKDQEQIIDSIRKYAIALEKSRLKNNTAQFKILTLSTSRSLRKQIENMVKNIQKNEFGLNDDNLCIIKAEEEFYYNNSYNFWYALDEEGKIIGSVGVKKIDKNSGEIKKFFVVKEYRGKKVAQTLMLKLLEAAKKHKFTHLYLGTVDVLKSAIKFYVKSGFVKIDKKSLPKNFKFCQVDNMFYKAKTSEVITRIKETFLQKM